MELSKLARPCILRRKEYIPGKSVEEVKRELGIDNVCKMASNENPLGVSPRALEAMIRELQSAHIYPEGLCPDLTQKLATLHDLTPQHILLDNGEDGIITLLGSTFLNPGEEIIVGASTFSAYENMADKQDAITVKTPMTSDCRLDVEAFLRAVTPKTKMLFICNPNNPTGTIITRREFERLLDATPERVLIIADEAYREFADDAEFPDALLYLAKYPNLVVMRTFSKIMGLAGLRIGYAAAHPEAIRLMCKAREPFSVNRAAQAGALAALDDHEFVQRTLQTNREGREQIYRALDEMDLGYCRSQANFIMVDLGRPAGPVFEAMLREGIIVRPLASFGLPNGLRISVGTREENERAIAALRKALGK